MAQAKRHRSAGDGSVWKAPEGWRAAVTVHLPDGRTTRRYLRAQSRSLLLDKMRTVKETEKRPDPTKLTVSEWLTHWLDTMVAPRRAETTVATRRSYCKRIVAHLGGLKLSQLAPMHIQAMLTALQLESRPGTVRTIHATLRAALEAAVRLDLLPRNPASRVDPPAPPARDKSVLSGPELDRLLRLVDASGHVYAPLWTVYALTGLRRGEGAGLTWDALDWEAGTLSVRGQITARSRGELRPLKSRNSSRTVDVPPRALAALRRQQQSGAIASAQNLVFRQPSGRAVNPNQVGEAFSRWTAEHYGRRLTLHLLRHSITTLLGRASVNPRVAADILGHSGTDVTLQVYSHPNQADRRAAMVALDRLIAEGD